MSDRLEDYIQGKLTAEERAAFEKEASPEEMQEVAYELGVRKGVEEAQREELKKKMAGFEVKYQSKRSVKPLYLKIAATLLVISSFTILLTRNSDSLYDQYYTSYPNYEFTTVRGEEDESLKAKAYTAYDQKDFKEAEILFGQLITNEADVPTRFFRGMSRMELKNYEEASADFETIRSSGEGAYIEAAYWYGALCAIQLKEQEKGRFLLEKILSSKDFGEKAVELKSKL